MSDLSFTISDGPIRVLTDEVGGCHPASITEIEMWDRIQVLERDNERIQTDLDHFYALAVDDPGKNPPVFYKDIVEELRAALEPFAALPDNANGKSRYFIEFLVCPEGDTPKDGVKEYGKAIRAARAALSARGSGE